MRTDCEGENVKVSRSDLLSEQLRAAEREVDSVYLANSLVTLRFAEAAWYFLAFGEETVVRHLVNVERGRGRPSTSFHDYAAVIDNLIVHSKWPMRWLVKSCSPGGRIPRKYNEHAYEAAWQLSDISLAYLSFESAFTYASLGIIQLTVDGNRLIPSPEFREDTRFDAYDRLVEGPAHYKPQTSLQPFLDMVARSVKSTKDWFTYSLNPKTMAIGIAAFEGAGDQRFDLPAEWQLPRYSVGEYARVGNTLLALALAHSQARMTAARNGCLGMGYSRALLVMERGELMLRLRRYTRIDEATLNAIVEDLTFGARGIVNPDPALQPLILLNHSTFGIAPNLITGNSLERNLLVLLNRLASERDAYSRLSSLKEGLARDRMVDEISRVQSGWRTWFGKIPGWGSVAEVDFVLIDDKERCCIIFEMKSFIAPAEAREIRDRSAEIARGIEQIRKRRKRAQLQPAALLTLLEITEEYRLGWVVVSDTSIGSVTVQVSDVPVIITSHLLRKLRAVRSLTAICDWLESRSYLPVEGIHYKVADFDVTLSGWTLPWFGIHALVDDFG